MFRSFNSENKSDCVCTKKKNALYLSVNVFSTKVLIGTLYFTSPNGDGTAILRGHPSHAKVQPPAGQRKYLHFSVIFKTLSIGPAAGIELATSRSAVKRSIDWATCNPAAVGSIKTWSFIIHSLFLPFAFILFQISFISRLQRFWFHILSTFTFSLFKIFTCYCSIILHAILYFKL